MIRKKFLAIFLATSITFSVGIIGCGYNNITNGGNTVKNVATSTKNSVKNLWGSVTDRSMKYTASQLVTDLKAKGYDLTETDTTKSNFSVDSKTYDINGEKLSVYEYGKNQSNKIKADINSITDNGTKINGNTVNWAVTPHIYKKGRVVVVYDGDNSDVKSTLKSILGKPVLG